MRPLVSFIDCTVTRGGRRLLGPVSWELERGDHVAVTGANGAGKTTFLRLLRGDLAPDSGGERIYDFGQGPQRSVLGLRHRVGMVSADMQDFYFLHTKHIVGRNVILAGFFDSPILYEIPTEEQEAAADAIIDSLGIRDLAESEVGALSTGQVRKLLVARGLVAEPDILLLDESLDGLDTASRAEVLHLLDIAGKRTTLVCAAHRVGDVPDCIKRTVVLDAGRVVAQGNRDEMATQLRTTMPEVAACDLPEAMPDPAMEFLLRMRQVSVVVDGRRILNSVNWDILPGENWMVLGENGAGKSTLLKLVTSEISPYADDVDGVGSIERLGGLTMDEARPLIGVVSPDLQASYARELGWEVTAEETVMSGYRGSVGMLDQPTSEEKLGADKWLEMVGLHGLGARRLRRMSYGQQRRVFLARAMAPGPKLLLLDEPFSGLDADSLSFMRGVVQRLAESGVPIVLVTHHVEDKVPALNRILALEQGRVRFYGSRDDFAFGQRGGNVGV